MIILKTRSSSIIFVHLNHGNENTIHFQSKYLYHFQQYEEKKLNIWKKKKERNDVKDCFVSYVI